MKEIVAEVLPAGKDCCAPPDGRRFANFCCRDKRIIATISPQKGPYYGGVLSPPAFG